MPTLSFWGAAGTVTGSKYLIETDRAGVLIDCGLFQGGHELRDRNWQEPPFDAASLKAIIITHAHIDHTGYLPRVVRHGFRGPIYCSRGTSDLLKILLPDSARLQEEEADYRNRLHDTEQPKNALERIIKNAAARNSVVLIPAFAVGRAQEIVYLIRELEDENKIPVVPVIVDSPMAAAATQAYAARTEEQDEDYTLALKRSPTPLRTH